MDDVSDGGTRWLSYGELATARGISKASATRLAFRRRWARQESNDGTARVAVPLSELELKQPPPRDGTHDDTPDDGGVTRVVSGLEGMVALLRQQLERERRLADEARADLRSEREASRERQTADAEERRRLAERIAALEAQQAAPRANVPAWVDRLREAWRSRRAPSPPPECPGSGAAGADNEAEERRRLAELAGARAQGWAARLRMAFLRRGGG